MVPQVTLQLLPLKTDENLKINANCFPVLANVESLTKSICNSTNSEVSYKIEIKKFGKWKCC
jgi:hypothetical protein